MTGPNPPYYQTPTPINPRTCTYPGIRWSDLVLALCCCPCILGARLIKNKYRQRFPKKVKIATEPPLHQRRPPRWSPDPLSTASPRHRLSFDAERKVTGETESEAIGVHVTGECERMGRDARDMQTTHDQLQSGLFQLPFELRKQIWDDVLGGYVFHIFFVEAYRRMSHVVRV